MSNAACRPNSLRAFVAAKCTACLCNNWICPRGLTVQAESHGRFHMASIAGSPESYMNEASQEQVSETQKLIAEDPNQFQHLVSQSLCDLIMSPRFLRTSASESKVNITRLHDGFHVTLNKAWQFAAHFKFPYALARRRQLETARYILPTSTQLSLRLSPHSHQDVVQVLPRRRLRQRKQFV